MIGETATESNFRTERHQTHLHHQHGPSWRLPWWATPSCVSYWSHQFALNRKRQHLATRAINKQNFDRNPDLYLLAQSILYPNGTLSHRAFSHITWPDQEAFPPNFTMVVKSQCAFLERSALKKIHLFKVDNYDVTLKSIDEAQIIDFMNRNNGPS